MARLDFYQNGQLFIKLRTASRPIAIGRSNDCDVILPHPKISRKHATLEPDGDGWLLKNHGMNGTRVNAELVKETRPLCFGDRLYVETYIVIFSDDDDDDEFLLDSTGTAMSVPRQKAGA